MAINFPATGGQATDGSFTYTVAGIVYAWNGASWAAAGAGASASAPRNASGALPDLLFERVGRGEDVRKAVDGDHGLVDLSARRDRRVEGVGRRDPPARPKRPCTSRRP